MDNNYTFSAFISYKREDEKAAKWLQNKLENYRLPVSLCKKYAFPKKLGKVFRDTTDLSSGELKKSIADKISQCRYLIVICSPHTQQTPEYIDYEIETFRKQRGNAFIIPYIIGGEANAADSGLECYPPSLRSCSENELLGISELQDGKKTAALKTVAALLGIDADEVIRRNQARERKKHAVLAAALCACVLLGIGTWLYTRPVERYYIDYVLKQQIPVGIGELDNAQRKHVCEYYVITTRLGKVRELKHVNSDGSLCEQTGIATADRPVKAVYAYNADASLNDIEYYDTNNCVIQILQFPKGSIAAADFKNPLSPEAPLALGSKASQNVTSVLGQRNEAPRSSITRYEYTYDENGYVTRLLFRRNNLGEAACDESDIYGIAYTVDAMGRVAEKYYLDAQGERRLNAAGVYGYRYTYNAQNKMTAIEAFGADGKPVLGELGFYRVTSEYDDNFNCTSVTFMDADGQPLYNAYFALESQKQEYDGFGHIVKITSVKEDHTLVVVKKTYDANGYTAFLTKFQYDSLETELESCDFAPIFCPFGSAK